MVGFCFENLNISLVELDQGRKITSFFYLILSIEKSFLFNIYIYIASHLHMRFKMDSIIANLN
jgi:hypothetical protein